MVPRLPFGGNQLAPPPGALPFGLFGEGVVPYCPEPLGFWLMPFGLLVGWLFCVQPAAASKARDTAAVSIVLRDMGMFLHMFSGS
jgi:hypothetical protein